MVLLSNMGRRTSSLVVVLLLAALSPACTDSADDDGRAGGPAPPEGVFRIGLEPPPSLDPAQVRFPPEVLLTDQLFDGLTAYDPATLAVRPAIAATWQANDDQTRWEFTIRPDARFANGRQITSDDVRYTLERIARRGSGSPASTQLELVQGFQAFNSEGDAESLAGVTAPAPETLVVELDQPFSALPAVLGNPSFGIVPREAVEAPAPVFADQPVGSGPFTIASRSDQAIQLVPVPGAPTQLKAIDVRLGTDAELYAEFDRGGLDWAPVPRDQLEEAADRYGRDGFRPYVAEFFYGFNLANPKFADARFREAIVRAVDREAILRVVFGGRVRVVNGLVAEGVPGSQADACGERCRYDPARAQALVKEAFGGGPAPEIRIDFDDDPTQQALAQAVQANLQAVGIPVALRAHTYADYLTFIRAGGEQELFRLAWIGTYPSPDAYLTPLFVGGSFDNVTRFASEDVDNLLKQAIAEPDEARRTEAYQQAERLVLEQLPVLPMGQYEIQRVVSDRVEGLVMSTFGTFDATAVRLK